MIPSPQTITRSNSFTRLDELNKTDSTNKSILLTLPPTIFTRAIRSSSTYNQSTDAGATQLNQRCGGSRPATSLAIQPGRARITGSDSKEKVLNYDILLLGTHGIVQNRRTGKHCLFVALLPHLPEKPVQTEVKHRRQFSLFNRVNSSSGSELQPPQPPQPSVVVHSSYGEVAHPSSIQPNQRNQICGRGYRRKGNTCNAIMSRMMYQMLHPFSTIRSFFSRSIVNSVPPVRHYPKIASLSEHGLQLEEVDWPWKESPFFGLDLVWEEDDLEWLEREVQNKTREFVNEDDSANHRELPIHPSHLCIDPGTGEILITDHERHAVFSVIPCWIIQQKLLELITPPKSAVKNSPSLDCDDWFLPLPDVLLDFITGYLGNQVRLLAGESNVKGCSDGEGTDAHFNAPNGVTVHPRTGQLFVTDGHWNSRICTLQPNIVPQPLVQTITTNASTSDDSTEPKSATPTPPAVPYPPRWNVASVPLHPQSSKSSSSSPSTWFSAVRHSGPHYNNMPSIWPLRLPTSPILMEDNNPQTDALVLLDEELHVVRMIPLTGSSSGQISTVSGQFGLHGRSDGWSSSARFLFPQSLISIPHPLSSPMLTRDSEGNTISRSLNMKDRQAILVADTGNDRLCLVNLISREEIRLEKRKQAMMRRQMKAIAARNESNSSHASDDEEDDDSDGDDDDDDSDSDSSAGGVGGESDIGPLVGHVESIPIRGRVPLEYEEHFIATPWTPFTPMVKNANFDEEEESKSNPSNSIHHHSSASSISITPSSLPPLTILPPSTYIHRGQNTYLRKLCISSQGRVIGLNRLGLMVMEWTKA